MNDEYNFFKDIGGALFGVVGFFIFVFALWLAFGAVAGQ